MSQDTVKITGNLQLNNVNESTTIVGILVINEDGTVEISQTNDLLKVITEDTLNQKLGVRTPNPTFTVDITHANGSPGPFSSDPTNGLNIRNEGANNENWTLYVSNTSGSLQFYNDDLLEIEFTKDGSLNQLSDARFKLNIELIDENVLNKIMQLKARKYSYINNPERERIGFLAQEVNTIIPEVVENTVNDAGEQLYTISYNSIVPILVKGMQEQQELLNNQQDQIKTLNKKYEEIMKKLALIENQLNSKQ